MGTGFARSGRSRFFSFFFFCPGRLNARRQLRRERSSGDRPDHGRIPRRLAAPLPAPPFFASRKAATSSSATTPLPGPQKPAAFRRLSFPPSALPVQKRSLTFKQPAVHNYEHKVTLSAFPGAQSTLHSAKLSPFSDSSSSRPDKHFKCEFGQMLFRNVTLRGCEFCRAEGVSQ